MSDEILAEYVRQADRADVHARRSDQQYRNLKSFTPWLSLAWIAIFACALFAQSNAVAWWVGGGIVLLLTAVLSWVQQTRHHQKNVWKTIAQLHRAGANRITRNWDSSFHVFDLNDDDAWLARDLDLLGSASLFELMCTAQSSGGQLKLSHWLLNPASPKEIFERQEAVKFLQTETGFRQNVEVVSRQYLDSPNAFDEILVWCRRPGFMASRGWLRVLTIVLPLIFWTSTLASVFGFVSPGSGLPIAVSMAVANAILTVFFIGPVHDVFHEIQPEVSSRRLKIVEIFASVSRMKTSVRLLQDIRQHSESADRALQKLQRLIRFTLLARNPWTTVCVYFPLQLTTLFDFHLLRKMEAWKSVHQAPFEQWIKAFSTFEALASLATLAHDHPTWQFPKVIDDAETMFAADELGHPLLPDNQRITNDSAIGPVGRMLLVTGSNMSGKSTMLRAIGLNAILAQSGAPVCAKQLTMSPLKVVTSIRVMDSLQSGVSLFMAEVNRLKRVIELAAQTSEADGLAMLFLFDEVLHGTNTSERHVALRRVLGHLLSHRVIGAITTHDLQLADEPEIRERSELVHFRDILQPQDGRPTMTFDYKMRPGIAPTTNALALLDLVGLGEQNMDENQD